MPAGVPAGRRQTGEFFQGAQLTREHFGNAILPKSLRSFDPSKDSRAFKMVDDKPISEGVRVEFGNEPLSRQSSGCLSNRDSSFEN
jgi:hypothetical protein